MENIKALLVQLHNIFNCAVAIQMDDSLYAYPPESVVLTEDQEPQGYKMTNIYTPKGEILFYVKSREDIPETSLRLAALYIKSQLKDDGDLEKSVLRILKGEYDPTDISAVEALLSEHKRLQLIVVGSGDTESNGAEMQEIVCNSLNTGVLVAYQGNLVVLTEESDIKEACGNLQKNILTEIFVETAIAIGGSLKQPQQLRTLYNSCAEALQLKRRYAINLTLLDNQNMLLYKLISCLEPRQKQDIMELVFTDRFEELLNSEMEQTIEEMFRNNLNLTDTSARLYIHRNTLLYRIDKIYKHTGFDLRRFEDSMLFKLAWLMYKEHQISK